MILREIEAGARSHDVIVVRVTCIVEQTVERVVGIDVQVVKQQVAENTSTFLCAVFPRVCRFRFSRNTPTFASFSGKLVPCRRHTRF